MKKLSLKSVLIWLQVIIVLIIIGTIYFSTSSEIKNTLFAVGKFFFHFFTMSPAMTIISICLIAMVIIKLIMNIRYERGEYQNNDQE